jgi:hypothetical protein
MKIITEIVSHAWEPVNTGHFERSKAEARARIAAHHFGCHTAYSPVFTRLLTGLRSRGIVREPGS